MKYKCFISALILTLLTCSFLAALFFAGEKTMDVGFQSDSKISLESEGDGYKFSVMGKSFTVDISRIQADLEGSLLYSALPNGARAISEIYGFLEEKIEKIIKEIR